MAKIDSKEVEVRQLLREQIEQSAWFQNGMTKNERWVRIDQEVERGGTSRSRRRCIGSWSTTPTKPGQWPEQLKMVNPTGLRRLLIVFHGWEPCPELIRQLRRIPARPGLDFCG